MTENINMLTEKIDFCKSIKAKIFKAPVQVIFSKYAQMRGEIFGKTEDGASFIVFIEPNRNADTLIRVFFLAPEIVLAASSDVLYNGEKLFNFTNRNFIFKNTKF